MEKAEDTPLTQTVLLLLSISTNVLGINIVGISRHYVKRLLENEDKPEPLLRA